MPEPTSELIGKRFELWQSSYKSKAYTDQMGVAHDAYVVQRKAIVTVTDTRDVQGSWSGKTYEDGYLIAKDEAGVEYTQAFNETSMHGRFAWSDSVNNSWHLAVADGIAAPYINIDGTKAVPQTL